MPTDDQWRKACVALDAEVVREIIADNPNAAQLIRRRLRRHAWRPAPLLTAPASVRPIPPPPLILITTKKPRS